MTPTFNHYYSTNMSVMAGLIRFCLFITLFTRGRAIRCFECQAVPYPRDCSKVAECNFNESCFTEQIVTTSGNIIYHSGCLSNSRCSDNSINLLGKRSDGTDKRATDLSTCIECCTDSFCNRNGCGVQEIPLGQRGPYCYNCDAVLDPKSCESVAVCMTNEVCMLNVAVEFNGLPETVYRTRCGKQSTCDELSGGMNSCAAMCCKTDFCNDQCLTFKNTSIITESTQKAFSTTKTTVVNRSTMTTYYTKPSTENVILSESTSRSHTPSTTKAPTHCRDHGGYMHLQGDHTSLCVHIVTNHNNWGDARSACKKEAGDLVVLDTHEKSLLLRRFLAKHSEYKNHISYWIGAKEYKEGHYHWVNHHNINDNETDWAPGQPDNRSQNCIAMVHEASFKWNNKVCSDRRNYICEI